MADVKISGLPASTTPLAGTEVLPVVQGGITKKVAVSDLTAGRAVSASSLALTGSALPVTSGGSGTATQFTTGSVVFAGASGVYSQDNANLFWDDTNNRLGLGTVAPAGTIDVSSATGIFSRRSAATDQFVNIYADGIGPTVKFSGVKNAIVVADATCLGLLIAASGAVPITFSTNNTEKMRVHSSGGVSIGNITDPGATNLSVTGNVVMATSGKGIDFSATAGTGTSELLADYEEGTFTATLTPSTSGSITMNAGFDTLAYTKVGRLVTVTGRVIVSSVSSPLGRFDINLPFAISTLTEDSGHFSGMVTVENTVSANMNTFGTFAVSGNSIIRVLLTDATTFQSTSAPQIKAGTSVWVSFSYFST